MYATLFHLRQMPFDPGPDPAFLYLSSTHQEALGHLLFGTGQHGGFVQLTGEAGTGKTTVIEALLAQKLAAVDVAVIQGSGQSELEFLQALCKALRVEVEGENTSSKLLLDAFNAHLLRVHVAGRRTVLIVDDAHKMSRDGLEQVRLLTNLETHKDRLLRIMLVGQPELSAVLDQSDLRQLASRITVRYYLMPLTEHETGEYIRHRLRVAGRSEPVFTPGAVREIDRGSRGLPRLINLICDRALLGAYARGLQRVTPALATAAAVEVIGVSLPALSRARGPVRLAANWLGLPGARLVLVENAVTVVCLLIAGLLFYQTFFAGPGSSGGSAISSAQAMPQSAPPAFVPANDEVAAVAAATKPGPAIVVAQPAAAPAPQLATVVDIAAPAPGQVDPWVLASIGASEAPAAKSVAAAAEAEAVDVLSSPVVRKPESPKAANQSRSKPKAPPKSAVTFAAARKASPKTGPAAVAGKDREVSPSRNSAAAVPPPDTELASLLQPQQSLSTVVTRLVRLWDRNLQLAEGVNVCSDLSARGLECYKAKGSWADLRAANRPAVITLRNDRGQTQHVLLRGLTASFATIETATGTLGVPVDALGQLWTGEYLLLWQPGKSFSASSPGAAGTPVLTTAKR